MTLVKYRYPPQATTLIPIAQAKSIRLALCLHPSLLIECSPSDVTTATKDDQRKDHLAEEQQDDAADTEQPNLLDHGLALICQGVPLHARHFVIDRAFGFIDDARRKSQTLQVLNENKTRDQLIQSGRQEPCIQE